MAEPGYLNPAYARSLAEFGTPRRLNGSGAWILAREIAGADHWDAMNCYPIFTCLDWSGLPADLENLGDLVSLTVVTDPFGDYDRGLLQRCFPDVMFLFKQHFVTDLSMCPEKFVSPHHHRNARRALRRLAVTRCDDPPRYGREWTNLYGQLIRRHKIRGIAAFSKAALRSQLEVPGLQMFRAEFEGEPAGMVLWMVQNGIAYYHLGAYNEPGYREGASFALFWASLEYFRSERLGWLSLGAGAGIRGEDNGLARFKRGWSTGARPVYLCCRILDPEAYARLASQRSGSGFRQRYFPAYREGEFG